MNPKSKSTYNIRLAFASTLCALALPGVALAQIDNADLIDLVPSVGILDPVFDSATISYTASVTASNITLTPTAAEALATITVNGDPVASGDASAAIPLNLGSNVISTVVTAEDEATTKTYTFTVTRTVPATITTAPVAYWPMRDGTPGQTVPTGTGNAAANVIDIANTFVNGTVNNTNSTWEADPLRGVVWSTTEGNRINAGTQGIDLANGFTWSLWVNVATSNITDPGADCIIGTRSGWHKIDLTSISNWNGQVPTSGAYPNLARSEWIHLAYVGHSSFGRRFYVDGQLVASNATTTTATFNNALEIGGTSQFSEDITGLYSDVAIWNQALTVEQITDLANGANVIADVTAPVLAASSPPNEDAEATVVNGLLAIFDEPVTIGSGDIRIYDSTGPTLVATIDVTDATQVSPTGAGILIDPTATLNGGTTYYIEMDAGVVKNASNLDFAGFTGSTTWSFTVDNLPPTVVSLNDEYNGTSFGENLSSLEFIVTFNEAIDGSSVSATDFGNAGDATISIGTVTQVAPEVFTVEVLPTTTGTLQLSILSGSVILDLSGNALDTTAAILSDTISTITAGNTGGVTITGTAGGNNSWNTATNWSGDFVPKVVWGAIITDGIIARANNTTPAYSGGLTIGAGSELDVQNNAGAVNAIGTGPITLNAGATLRLRRQDTITIPGDIEFAGNAQIINSDNSTDNRTRILNGDISGTGIFTYSMRRGNLLQLNGTNTWSGGFIANFSDTNFGNASRVQPANSGFGTGDVTLNDGITLEILSGRGDTIDDGAALFLNGRGRSNQKVILGSNETISELWLDNTVGDGTGSTQLPAGDYTATSSPDGGPAILDITGAALITGSGTLTVLNGPDSPPTLDSIADNQGGGPVATNALVTYTLTFSKNMNATTIDATDFGNAGSSSITIGTITEVSPTVFTVEVTPTTAGTLKFQINQGAVIEDVGAIALDTTTAIEDTTEITVNDPSSTSPFEDWAGAGVTFTDDASGDGIANGLAWVLGAVNPGDNALALLPTFDNTSDPDFFIFTYRRLNDANEDVDVTILVQYSSDLAVWQPAEAGVDIEINVTDDGAGVDIDLVEVKIRRTLADGQKLFARLNVELAQPVE